MAQTSEAMENYFSALDRGVKKAVDVANRARAKGYDPEQSTDIPIAHNMAERVEGLISAVTPQIKGSGIVERIQELEKQFGTLAWQVALQIAKEVAEEKFCRFRDRKEAIETGIRTGFAYVTVGVVSAPLEGFIELKIKKRHDGKEYLAPSFTGPVRGAGGTAAAFCVLLVDFLRRENGYAPYDPSVQEVNRIITELDDYHDRVTNLQYRPSAEELAYLVRNLPVEVDGEPSETIEVSNYKDLPRIETNKIRSGVCLVVSMLALKAPKIWKELSSWGSDFGLQSWNFLERFIEIQKRQKAKDVKSEDGQKISPDFTFISDLVAGRPVLTFPLAAGGFRLRYGKTRMSGFSAASIHPITMRVLEEYIATGTQLKTERPGKAAAITPCDTIEPPIVRLKNGNVLKLDEKTIDKQTLADIEEILFLGDLLISYGDFYDRAHPLVPAGYVEEWFAQELEEAIKKKYSSLDMLKASQESEVAADRLQVQLEHPLRFVPTAKEALAMCRTFEVPMHPCYTYYWKCLGPNHIKLFEQNIALVRKSENKLVFPYALKRCLELAGIPHVNAANEFCVVTGSHAEALEVCLGLSRPDFAEQFRKAAKDEGSFLKVLQSVSLVKIMDKCGTFIGARMGRPEKAKMRKMTGSPHVLFPVGQEGGRLRSFQGAIDSGKVTADLPIYRCGKCDKETVYARCETCDSGTEKQYHCPHCGILTESKCIHGNASPFRTKAINISELLQASLAKLKTKTFPDLIKGVKGTSNETHVVENLVKGILRAKHNVYVNKDGTIRYDMTEIPLTHFTPQEIGTGIGKLRELGYEKDIYGKPLADETQLLELKPQDLVLPGNASLGEESAKVSLFKISKFIDELLVKLYGQRSFYSLKTEDDVIGCLVVGLAPHTSAGILGRVIGFSQTQCMLAHPLFHAAMRRDADGDESCVMLLMDSLLNFSRQYLPNKRGARTMDAPLVLTARLIPSEVDDLAFRFDVSWQYPLKLYRAAAEYRLPWEVKVPLMGDYLGTERQYEGYGYTHLLSGINIGLNSSAYKTLPSMEEKLKGQMAIAEKVRAVDQAEVARLVIEKHFIKDIKGNLRKFSVQQFRCVNCNRKFRRPPLIGRCDKCDGKLMFTISHGSIVKYLEPAISLANKYHVSPYLRQTLDLTRRHVDEVFGQDKEKQTGLGAWFG